MYTKEKPQQIKKEKRLKGRFSFFNNGGIGVELFVVGCLLWVVCSQTTSTILSSCKDPTQTNSTILSIPPP